MLGVGEGTSAAEGGPRVASAAGAVPGRKIAGFGASRQWYKVKNLGPAWERVQKNNK